MGIWKLLDGATAVGASKAIRLPGGSNRHTLNTSFVNTGVTAVTAVKINLQGATANNDEVVAASKTEVFETTGLAIGSTAEQISWAAFGYRIDDTNYTVALDASEALPTAHTVAASKFGVINVYINSAGAISTKVPGTAGAQLTAQTYATALAAIAAAELVVAPVSTVYIGRILILNDASLWTAGTDDLTDASDVVTADFFPASSLFINLVEHPFTGNELIDRRAVFHQSDKHVTYIRAWLETLTGTAAVTAKYEDQERW